MNTKTHKIPKALQASRMNIITSNFLLPSKYGMSIRERFNVVEILWKHLHTQVYMRLTRLLQNLFIMKDKLLKQHSFSMDPKTWHMAILTSFINVQTNWMSSLDVDISNHMHFKWVALLAFFLEDFSQIVEYAWLF